MKRSWSGVAFSGSHSLLMSQTHSRFKIAPDKLGFGGIKNMHGAKRFNANTYARDHCKMSLTRPEAVADTLAGRPQTWFWVRAAFLPPCTAATVWLSWRWRQACGRPCCTRSRREHGVCRAPLTNATYLSNRQPRAGRVLVFPGSRTLSQMCRLAWRRSLNSQNRKEWWTF